MTCNEAALETSRLGSFNVLPVSIDPSGVPAIGRQRLQLPIGMDEASCPGKLVFATDSACLLLGPWGPDPRRHLTLRGRMKGICPGGPQFCLELELEPGLPPVQLCLPRHRYDSLRLNRGQRLWISIPADALTFIAEPEEATVPSAHQWPEAVYSPALG